MTRNLFSLAEVASDLGVPQSEIRALIADGVVSVPQVAGRFVFRTRDVEAVEAALADASEEDVDDASDEAEDDAEGESESGDEDADEDQDD